MNPTHNHQVLQVLPEWDQTRLTPAGKRLQKLMRSDEVVEYVTYPWAQTIFGDPTYTDILVIWDHGEGPQCPNTFEEPVDWRRHRCLPPEVWEYAAEVVAAHSLWDTYTWIWLRSEEVGETPEEDIPASVAAGLGDTTLGTLRRCLHDLSGTVDEGVRFKACLAAQKEELRQRAITLAQQIDDISLVLARQAYPDKTFERPLFFGIRNVEAALARGLPPFQVTVKTEGVGFDTVLAHAAVSPLGKGGIPLCHSLIAHGAELMVWPEGRWSLRTNYKAGMTTFEEVIEWYASRLRSKRAEQ